MEELHFSDINKVAGGNPATAIGIGLGFIGAFNSLTSFGAGLGSGLYDALHKAN
jgi:hypothetical protein